MHDTISIVFFGTHDFAVPILSALHANPQIHIQAVITQPDKPVGRQQHLQAPPVKIASQKRMLPVWQPEHLSEEVFLKKITSLQTDVYIVAQYGKLIPKSVLILPKKGVLNVHTSLLPAYRGASPVQSAILQGEKISGITIMLMDEQVDHGPILVQKKIPITPADTTSTLMHTMATEAALLLPTSLTQWIYGHLSPQKQSEEAATYTTLLRREDGCINPEKSAEKLERMWRAYTPWPSVFMYFFGKRLKIHTLSLPSFSKEKNPPGTLYITHDHLYLACGEHTTLELLEVQVEGKKRMGAKDFIQGEKKRIPLIPS